MFSRNKNGKMACIYGVPALLLSAVAKYSEEYQVNNDGNAFVAPIINMLLTPYRWVESSLTTAPTTTEPTVSSLTVFYVFEGQALIITFIAALIFTLLSMWKSIISARNHEFSI